MTALEHCDDSNFKRFKEQSSSNTQSQLATGGTLKVTQSGYDPLWVWENYGNRLDLLPADLRDAVYEAMRNGEYSPFLEHYFTRSSNSTILNQLWSQEAHSYIKEIAPLT